MEERDRSRFGSFKPPAQAGVPAEKIIAITVGGPRTQLTIDRFSL